MNLLHMLRDIPREGEGTGGAGGGGTPPWYGTTDAETMTYLTSRGLDKMTPDKAALAAIQSHREAEKLLGVPKEQLIQLPKDDSDVDGWNKVHARLGAVADPKEYDFSTVKVTGGEALTDDVINSFRDLAHEMKLSKPMATLLVQRLVALGEKSAEGNDAESAAILAQEQDKLKQSWGFSAATNQIVADNAMRALGVTDEQKSALKAVVGHAAVMEMFRNIGARIGEDSFITNKGPNGSNIAMTREAAEYRLDQLKNDTIWYDKLMKGDAQAAKEFNDLTARIVS